jgi:Asp-tRNA(Asn)/Glu-tRNA(Gln) amidotransferase A subunit family amidase
MSEVLQTIEKNIFLDLSIKDILDKIQKGEISPLDIAGQCIDRIEEYNDLYKVWVCYSKEILFKQAEETSKRLSEGEKLRRLEGIPVGNKRYF